MDTILTNAEMRAADEYTINNLGISSEVLMHRAGAAIADEVEAAAKNLNACEVIVVCGTGNNGGDGYVCASELLKRGINVKVFAFDGRLSPDCEREKSGYKGAYSSHISGSIIVDCIFGTGLCRDISGEYLSVIEKINSSGALVVSADIPSGLNGDNGLIQGAAVNADLTVAIACIKSGMLLNDGLDCCGKIVVKDIGITLPKEKYIAANYSGAATGFFPKRRRNTHKGSFGTASLIAGSDKYYGAAVLATKAALKSGCGYVKLKTSEKIKSAMAVKLPQVIYADEIDLNSSAIAIGMGCGVDKNVYESIKYILGNYRGKLLIDADGLNSLAKYGLEVLKNKKCEVLLTPHIKEFSRLTESSVEDIITNPVNLSARFAREYGVTLLLKSCTSIITDGKNTFINVKGNSSLAKGGSGDILSGFICGSLARGLDIFNGAICGAQTLGIAAEIASMDKTDYCATAADIIENLHFSVKRLTE